MDIHAQTCHAIGDLMDNPGYTMPLSQPNVLENIEESHERLIEEHSARELAQQVGHLLSRDT